MFPPKLDINLDVQVMQDNYTVSEVAAKLGLSDKTLRRWEDEGRFHSSRTLGNQRRYTMSDIQILDAIKRGVIPNQADLLTIEAAASLCGVSPVTVDRWEREGKIHPFVTVGTTYYPRHQLLAKLGDMLKAVEDPVQTEKPAPPPPPPTHLTRVVHPRGLISGPPAPSQPLSSHSADAAHWAPYLINLGLTLLLLAAYHLWLNSPSRLYPPVQTSGQVQGESTSRDPRFDLLEKYFNKDGLLLTTTLSLTPSSAPVSPIPGTLYYDGDTGSLKLYKNGGWTDMASQLAVTLNNATLITGSGSLPQGKNQVSVSHPDLNRSSSLTVTFQGDYAPAKKYWVTPATGSFTVHTDFPVNADSPFNYSFVSVLK